MDGDGRGYGGCLKKLRYIWNLFGTVRFQELVVNLFLLEFSHEGDRSKNLEWEALAV